MPNLPPTEHFLKRHVDWPPAASASKMRSTSLAEGEIETENAFHSGSARELSDAIDFSIGDDAVACMIFPCKIWRTLRFPTESLPTGLSFSIVLRKSATYWFNVSSQVPVMQDTSSFIPNEPTSLAWKKSTTERGIQSARLFRRSKQDNLVALISFSFSALRWPELIAYLLAKLRLEDRTGREQLCLSKPQLERAGVTSIGY